MTCSHPIVVHEPPPHVTWPARVIDLLARCLVCGAEHDRGWELLNLRVAVQMGFTESELDEQLLLDCIESSWRAG